MQGVWLYNHRAFDAGYAPARVLKLSFVHTQTLTDTRCPHPHSHPRPRTHISQGSSSWFVQKRKILDEPCTPEITTQECTRTKKGGSNRHKQNKTVSRGKQQKHAHILTRTHTYTSAHTHLHTHLHGCMYVYLQAMTCKYTYIHACKYMHVCA